MAGLNLIFSPNRTTTCMSPGLDINPSTVETSKLRPDDSDLSLFPVGVSY